MACRCHCAVDGTLETALPAPRRLSLPAPPAAWHSGDSPPYSLGRRRAPSLPDHHVSQSLTRERIAFACRCRSRPHPRDPRWPRELSWARNAHHSRPRLGRKILYHWHWGVRLPVHWFIRIHLDIRHLDMRQMVAERATLD